MVLGTESGAFYIQGKYSTTEMHPVLLGVAFVSEGLIWLSRLDLPSSPCLCLQSAVITDLCHHAQIDFTGTR